MFWYQKEIPNGPWTLQLKGINKSFTELSIRNLSNSNVKPGNNFYRGYSLFKSGKVKNVFISNKNKCNDVFLKAEVQSSYRLKIFHKCFVKLDKNNGEIQRSYCNCKSGMGGKCSHVFSVLWCILDHLNSNKPYISINFTACTEKPQSWGMGSIKKSLVVKKYSDLSFVKHKPNTIPKNINIIAARKEKRSQIKANINSEHVRNYCLFMNNSKENSSFCYGVEKNKFEIVKKKSNIKDLDNNIPNDNNLVADTPLTLNNTKKRKNLDIPVKGLWGREVKKILGVNFKSFKFKNVSLKKAREIQNKTCRQGLTKIWKRYKTLVLSSTKFYPVINRRKAVTEAFVKFAFGRNDKVVDRSGYLQKGLDNEKFAVLKYKKIRKGYQVFSCGLCINPGVPILGTSPDRVVKTPYNELGLLEIKTLSKAIDLNIPLHEAIKKRVGSNSHNLDFNNGFMYLKRNSPHFYQIQGQMALCGLSWCDYFVDAGDEFFVERINFDEKFWIEEMLPKLVNFFNKYFPK